MRKTILIALTMFIIGVWLSYRFFNPKEEKRHTQVESSVLLERVKEVCKLVTVEGEFAEVYHETNLREVTLYLPIPTHWTFSKEALLEVKGKVLVGYDMEQVSVTVDSLAKQIRLSHLPQPAILAVEHDIVYRHLNESYFNRFTPADYTQLSKNAKKVLREKAYESGLIDQARKEGNSMIETIVFIGESIGWEVVYPSSINELPPMELKN